MSVKQRAVKLLDFTSGRDALYKTATGFLQALSAVCIASPGMEHSCIYHQIANALIHARAILRAGMIVEPIHKIAAIADLYRAQGWEHTDRKKFLELIRAFLRLFFRIGDALLLLHYYTTPYRMKGADVGTAVRHTLFGRPRGVPLVPLWWSLRVVQVASAVVSAALANLEWREGRRRLRYDPPAAHSAIRRAMNSLVQDLLDVLVNVLLATGGHNFNHEDRDNCLFNGNVYYSPKDKDNRRLLTIGLGTALSGLFTCRVLWNEKNINLVA